MPLSDQIEADLASALKAGEAERVSTLRMLRSSLKNKEIETGGPLEDGAVEQLIGKEVKQRRESAAVYREGGRGELAEKEEAEALLLQAYLPEPLSGEELEGIVDRVISEAGEGAHLGAVIGRVRSEVGSRAESSEIARLVTEKLKG
jgi:uncharacterized protein